MNNIYGQHGWREFHRNRYDILEEFDRILEQTKNRPVKVAHGIAVEAFLRKWLAEFLPKKFGVTSGYIIPNLYDDSGKIYHYDIIIYNRLDSPILWVEGNQDDSEQGKYRAIPAKHVLAVYEVKSRLNKKNVIDSINKLNQTIDFSDQLNPLYHCGIIFVDLKETENNNKSIIKELFKGLRAPGFRGGMILRYEGDDSCTGKIDFLKSDPKEPTSTSAKGVKLIPIAKPIDELNIYTSEEGNLTVGEQMAGITLVKTGQNNWSFSKFYGISYHEDNLSVILSWSRSHFSEFCIQLISSLEGLAFDDKNRPSFGKIFDTAEREKAPLQGTKKEEGKPYLEITVYDGSEKDKQSVVSQDGKIGEVSFWVLTKNLGDWDVVISDDSFENKLTLPKGKFAMKKLSFEVELDDESKSLQKMIEDNFSIPYRLVYYKENPDDSKKEFYAIEQVAKYQEGQFKFIDE